MLKEVEFCVYFCFHLTGIKLKKIFFLTQIQLKNLARVAVLNVSCTMQISLLHLLLKTDVKSTFAILHF